LSSKASAFFQICILHFKKEGSFYGKNHKSQKTNDKQIPMTKTQNSKPCDPENPRLSLYMKPKTGSFSFEFVI